MNVESLSVIATRIEQLSDYAAGNTNLDPGSIRKVHDDNIQAMDKLRYNLGQIGKSDPKRSAMVRELTLREELNKVSKPIVAELNRKANSATCVDLPAISQNEEEEEIAGYLLSITVCVRGKQSFGTILCIGTELCPADYLFFFMSLWHHKGVRNFAILHVEELSEMSVSNIKSVEEWYPCVMQQEIDENGDIYADLTGNPFDIEDFRDDE